MSRSDALMRAAKRWLYLGHRWTGILLCALFTIWFVSGVVMMYVPFPSFRASERIATSARIDWGKVDVDPARALHSIGADAFPDEMRLGMSAGEPVYRFVTENGRFAVSAVTGREIRNVTADQAKGIAEAYLHVPAREVVAVDHDQWVVTGAYKKMAPFWRVRMADDAGTDLYIARKAGEIVQNTTAHERFWNWLGAVPHWIYFEALRLHQEPWRQTVLWTSGIGILGAVAGIWIGVLRMRLRARYHSGSVSPYRGWMKWHHVTGLVGGLFLVTWVFSGWLSMSPWGGLRDEGGKEIAARYRDSVPAFPAFDPARMARGAVGASEVRFTYLGGVPVAIALTPQGGKTLLDGATGGPIRLSDNRIEAIARQAMPGAVLVSIERLTRYDRYWYATGDPRRDARPLPVLRLKFDDPAKSWLHIDPVTGELLNRTGEGSRAYRWLFSALHSFDLPLLLEWRPFRDALMWVLSAAGLVISVSGMVVGWRRLRRSSGRKSA